MKYRRAIKITEWLIAAQAVMAVLVLNLTVTTIVQRFLKPQMTEPQLFQNLPKSFFWEFKK